MALRSSIPGVFLFGTLACFAASRSASANAECMQQLADAGKRAGFETIAEKNEVGVFADSITGLNPLWSQMESCLNAAYSQQRTGTGRGRGEYEYRQWFNAVGDKYDWCATQVPAPGKMTDDPQKKDFAIWVRCGSGSAQLPNGMF
jgi:hypothetical protein